MKRRDTKRDNYDKTLISQCLETCILLSQYIYSLLLRIGVLLYLLFNSSVYSTSEWPHALPQFLIGLGSSMNQADARYILFNF